jgi:hypothetical protein
MGSFFKIGEALIRPEAAQTLPEYSKKPQRSLEVVLKSSKIRTTCGDVYFFGNPKKASKFVEFNSKPGGTKFATKGQGRPFWS